MTGNLLTIEELSQILANCTGVDVQPERLTARPQTTFEELDIDSLGLLGTVSELERLGFAVDAEADTCETPHELLAHVNALQAAGRPGRTENAVVVDAPLELVWDTTNDVASWTWLFSEYAKAEILERDGDTVRFRLTMHPDENDMVWSWVSERTMHRKTASVEAHRVETGPFEFMNIKWTYLQLDKGVEMRWVQDFRMRPDAPVTTAQMTDHINRNSLIQMERIKEIVERLAVRSLDGASGGQSSMAGR